MRKTVTNAVGAVGAANRAVGAVGAANRAAGVSVVGTKNC